MIVILGLNVLSITSICLARNGRKKLVLRFVKPQMRLNPNEKPGTRKNE